MEVYKKKYEVAAVYAPPDAGRFSFIYYILIYVIAHSLMRTIISITFLIITHSLYIFFLNMDPPKFIQNILCILTSHIIYHYILCIYYVAILAILSVIVNMYMFYVRCRYIFPTYILLLTGIAFAYAKYLY